MFVGFTKVSFDFGIINLNDVMIETLADNGNGSDAYVDDIDETRKLFVEDLTSTLQVIAQEAKIQVDFNPNVVAYYNLTVWSGLIGYENRDVSRRLLQATAGNSATMPWMLRRSVPPNWGRHSAPPPFTP